MKSYARAQSNFDAMLPPDDSLREAAIEARTEQLSADYWQDLEQLSDAFNDAAYKLAYFQRKAAWSPHPLAVTFLTLIRDGSDDLEAMRMLREAMLQYIAEKAQDAADDALS